MEEILGSAAPLATSNDVDAQPVGTPEISFTSRP